MTSTDIDVAPAPAAAPVADPEALIERMFAAGLAAMDLIAVYLGDRLGLYRLLAEAPRTARELAAAAGADERYLREWLEQQAVTAILTVDDPDADPADRRFHLPAGYHPSFLDPDSPLHLAPPMARAMVAVTRQAPALLRAFRTGEGVAYEAYGPDMREAIEAFNRPAFVNLLCDAWLPAMPDIDARLRTPGVRVAELACGIGPGGDRAGPGLPGPADRRLRPGRGVGRPRPRQRAEAGVDDRVTFAVRDASSDAGGGGYDLVASSRRSTTWPAPWRRSPPPGRSPPPTATSWWSTSAPASASPPRATTWSASSTAPASPSACPPPARSGPPPRPGR